MAVVNISLNRDYSGKLNSAIANVGAVRHGDILDLNGSGFGNTPPVIWYAGGISGLINKTAIDATPPNQNGYFFDTERPKTVVNDSWRGKVLKSVVWDNDAGTGDNGLIGHDRGASSVSGSKIYRYWQSKVVCNSTQFQWKEVRDEATNNFQDGGPEHLLFLWKKTTGRYMLTRSMLANSTATQYDFTGANFNNFDLEGEWSGRDWYRVVGSQGVANGSFTLDNWKRNSSASRRTVTGVLDFDSDVVARPRYTIWQNYLGSYLEGDPTIGDCYMSDLFVQTADADKPLVRAYVCNTSDIMSGSANIREIAEPITEGWIDTRGRFRINGNRLTVGQQYYLKAYYDDFLPMPSGGQVQFTYAGI